MIQKNYTELAMENCVFCKIGSHEIFSNVVYEDDDFMAIMDIAPINPGMVQVIPKTHYRWTWDVPNFGEYWEVARKVALAQIKGLGANMVEFLTHGKDVHHAHIWVVPIYADEAFIKSENRFKPSDGELVSTAEKIRGGIE